MKFLKILSFAVAFSVALSLPACKSKSTQGTNSKVDTATIRTAPVEISTDEALKNGAKDATKDYPGVTASVDGGEITLTGEITRDKLPTLMQALNALHPKKINNNLTIK